MKAEIFETKIHFPKAGNTISDECHDMYFRTKPWHSECMVFNDVVIIMAHKDDVHYIDLFDTKFGRVPREFVKRKDLDSEVKEEVPQF